MATAEKLHDIDVEHLEAAYDKPSSAPAPTDGDVKLVDADGNVRRIPVPSSDPNDPLNMNKWRKAGIVVTCCWFSIFSLVLVGGAGPILGFWMQEYTPQGKSTQDVVNLTTYPSLVMALGKSQRNSLCAVHLCDLGRYRSFRNSSLVCCIWSPTSSPGLYFASPRLHHRSCCVPILRHTYGMPHLTRHCCRCHRIGKSFTNEQNFSAHAANRSRYFLL